MANCPNNNRSVGRLVTRFSSSSLSVSMGNQDLRGGSALAKPHQTENTYKMSPDQEFPTYRVKPLIDEVLQHYLKDKPFCSSSSKRLTVELANAIKNRVKHVTTTRYKLTVFVILGQNQKCSVNVASRCAWDDKVDTFVEHSFTNGSLHASVLVYAVYQE